MNFAERKTWISVELPAVKLRVQKTLRTLVHVEILVLTTKIAKINIEHM